MEGITDTPSLRKAWQPDFLLFCTLCGVRLVSVWLSQASDLLPVACRGQGGLSSFHECCRLLWVAGLFPFLQSTGHSWGRDFFDWGALILSTSKIQGSCFFSRGYTSHQILGAGRNPNPCPPSDWQGPWGFLPSSVVWDMNPRHIY